MDSTCASGSSISSQVSPPSLVMRQGAPPFKGFRATISRSGRRKPTSAICPPVPGMAASVQVMPPSAVL